MPDTPGMRAWRSMRLMMRGAHASAEREHVRYSAAPGNGVRLPLLRCRVDERLSRQVNGTACVLPSLRATYEYEWWRPDARDELYFSYATCGSVDLYTADLDATRASRGSKPGRLPEAGERC